MPRANACNLAIVHHAFFASHQATLSTVVRTLSLHGYAGSVRHGDHSAGNANPSWQAGFSAYWWQVCIGVISAEWPRDL